MTVPPVPPVSPSSAQATHVEEVMTRKVATIGPEEDLVFAHSLMLWSNVRHLPVVRNGELVGILSDRDLLKKMARAAVYEDPTAVTEDIMTTPVETAKPGDDLGEVAARMAAKHIDCLPVVDEGKLVGIVTTTDVLAERGRLFFKGGPVQVPSVKTVMTKATATVHEEDDLIEAVRTMIEEDVRHLPVVDAEMKVVGMLSDRDVRGAVGDPIQALQEGEGRFVGRRVGDVMHTAPVTVPHEASLADLTSYFLDERIGALPVVDGGDRLIGIVSYIDLLRHVVATRG